MTKVQTTFRLSRSLTDQDLNSISAIHAVYGIVQAKLKPSLEELFIEYDASRLSREEVEGTLEEHGIPIA